MKPASRSSSYEVGRQVIAAAQVREELVDFAGRLGLYRPLPRAQELGLLPAVDHHNLRGSGEGWVTAL